MRAVDFAYWLQGVFELGDVKSFDERQTQIIRNHLNMVFIHDVDPSSGNLEHQQELQEAHDFVNQPPMDITKKPSFKRPESPPINITEAMARQTVFEFPEAPHLDE